VAEHDEGNCVICRRRDAESGYACQACATSLRSLLTELPDLYAVLSGPDVDEPSGYDPAPKYTDGRRERDYVGLVHPAGPVRAVADGPRTSGGPVEAAAPIDLTVLDLTAPSRMAARALAARGALGIDPDQIGDLSVPTILETWCRDWRDQLCSWALLPDPTVYPMCRWLADHLDAACQVHPAIDEFAQELRSLRARLRGVAGYSDRPELVPGRCPRCRWKALHRLPGDDWIRCGNEEDCGALWTPEELASKAA